MIIYEWFSLKSLFKQEGWVLAYRWRSWFSAYHVSWHFTLVQSGWGSSLGREGWSSYHALWGKLGFGHVVPSRFNDPNQNRIEIKSKSNDMKYFKHSIYNLTGFLAATSFFAGFRWFLLGGYLHTDSSTMFHMQEKVMREGSQLWNPHFMTDLALLNPPKKYGLQKMQGFSNCF